MIGTLPEPTLPLNPRTRQVYDEPKWTGYEVVLDVYPDVIAYGILLLPKDLKPGEKRPVVVCQHGLEGRPRTCIDPKERHAVYNSFAAQLAERGFIVYAPQNPYIGENDFRAAPAQGQPAQAVALLVHRPPAPADARLARDAAVRRPEADRASTASPTAARRPCACRPSMKRYCLSICSGDFNEWIWKNVSVDLDRSYMWTGEYEMFEFDLGNTFNYAEMAGLIAPRPFMVERGHDDGVGTDEMVAYEYAKVRHLYANRLKIPDRTDDRVLRRPPRDQRRGDVRVPAEAPRGDPKPGFCLETGFLAPEETRSRSQKPGL